MPKMPISESWTETLTTPRSYSSWAGCTTNRAIVLPARRRRLSSWRSLLLQVGRPLPQPFVHRRSVLTFLQRQQRRSELVPAWPVLYVAAEVSQGV